MDVSPSVAVPPGAAPDLGCFARPLSWRSAPAGGGRLLTIDGVDGSGKTSLAAALAPLVSERFGVTCRTVDFMSSWVRRHPQFVLLSEDLEHVATGRADITSLCAMCVGDRLANWRTKFSDQIQSGDWLIVDRYHLTPMADMIAFGADEQEKATVRSLLELLPRPDFSFVTSADASACRARVLSRPEERDKQQRPAITDRIVAAFGAVARAQGATSVNTGRDVDSAARSALGALEGLIAQP